MATVKIVRKKVTAVTPKVAKIKKDKPVVKKSATVKKIAPRVVKVAVKTPPPPPPVPVKLKMGDYGLITKLDSFTSNTPIAKIALDNKIPVYISNVLTDGRTLHIRIPDTAFNQPNVIAIQVESVRYVPTTERVALMKEIEEKGAIKREKDRKELLEKISPKHVRFTERSDYALTSKSFLSTNVNFVSLGGNIDTKDGSVGISRLSKNAAAVCCALSKTNNDMCVHIPIDWMSYFGYNVDDLRAWLAFISNCEIGFTAYLSETTPTLNSFYGAGTVPDRMPIYPNNNYYTTKDMKAYQVVIKGNKSYTMHSYMFFILLRYIYNNAYWNIPFIAMQLKAAFKEEVSFWDCLLLAHANHPYNGYYSLVNNQEGGVALPCPENSVTNVLQRLRSGNCSMNGSYTYKNASIKTISDLIKARDYKSLLELVNKYKK